LVLKWPSHFVLPFHDDERNLQLLHFAQSARESAFGFADGLESGWPSPMALRANLTLFLTRASRSAGVSAACASSQRFVRLMVQVPFICQRVKGWG